MAELIYDETGRLLFTKEMKKEYKILVPMMAPIHFHIIEQVLLNEGYQVELLENCGHSVVEEGLKYVHNDTCYPALLVIGQMMDALHSGKYDLHHTALLISQTGGGCRASNYIHLLRKALEKAGLSYIPVVSINLSGMEKNPGFTITFPMIWKMFMGLIYGDLIMLLSNQTRPYETRQGQTNELIDQWVKELGAQFLKGKGITPGAMKKNLKKIAQSFADIPVDRSVPRVKVGVVGEIYVKYSSLGNNHLEQFLASQGCEVMLPGLIGFMLFKIDNRIEDIKLYGGSSLKYYAVSAFMKFAAWMEKQLLETVKQFPQYNCPSSYAHMKEHLVKGVIGYGCKMGEGWLLTGEMLELAENGYENIVCTQPFGCLPNHIVGKGMVRRITERFPNANIVPIDYDPSATRVNQENRIKLMLSVARERLEQKEQEPVGNPV